MKNKNPDKTTKSQNIKKSPKKLLIALLITTISLLVVGIGIFVYLNNKTPDNPSEQANTGNTAELDQPVTPTITEKIKFEGRYIDVHAHIGISGISLTEVIKNMDTEGIDRIVIMKPPASVPVSTPQANFAIPDAALQYPDRFIVLYGGEAIAMLEKAATSGKYTKAEEEQFISLLEKEMKSGIYSGIGEIGLRHYIPTGTGKTSVAYDLTIPGSHPWMFIMGDIAAKYNVPIDIHMEATAETIEGLESLLDHNVNTKIIWNHAGWSHFVTKTTFYSDMATPQLMSQLMAKHQNLYSSVKLRKELSVLPIYIFSSKSEISPEWMEVFIKYPDRFMVGSDIKPGLDEDQFPMIKVHREFLNQLPSEILKKIERENAERIFNLE